MKRILGVGLVLFSIGTGFGQTCTQTLRLANETYNAGRLHELPKICEKCLDGKSSDRFTKEEQIGAYKLLAQAYIYLEEPEKADEAMLNLLKTDPFFELNEKADPAEFIALYNKFRTRPVISFTIKFGLTQTQVAPTAVYYVGNAAAQQGNFAPGFGIYIGGGIEERLSKKFTLAPEFFVITKNYTYTNPQVFMWDGDSGNPAASQKIQFSQTRLDFYPMVHYKLSNKKTFLNPFVGLGPGISYLSGTASSSNTNTLTRLADDSEGKSKGGVSGPIINTTDSFNKLAYSAIAMAGVKFRIGPVYITADLRFQYGLSNITKEKRTNTESVFDYAYQLPDFKTHNAMGTIGVIYPLFIPKKLTK